MELRFMIEMLDELAIASEDAGLDELYRELNQLAEKYWWLWSAQTSPCGALVLKHPFERPPGFEGRTLNASASIELPKALLGEMPKASDA